jgi:HAD superfamily hydrolase (TIGR01549 family)
MRNAVNYKAVFFDASLTLWRWEYDPAFLHLKEHALDPALVLFTAIKSAGVEVSEQELRRGYETLRPVYPQKWRAFESNGRGATQAQVQAHFDKHNEELLRILNLSDHEGQIMEAIHRAFEQWRPSLYPDVREVLETLRAHGFELAIVSNGWRQAEEAERLGIARYFSAIVGSVHVGCAKPQPQIFELALRQLGRLPEEAVHVGDDYEDDVVGARSAGIDLVLLDRDGTSDRNDILTIRSFRELLSLVI